MSSRKSSRLTAKAVAATQFPQKNKHLGSTTTKKVPGPRNSKKQRTSKEKDALNDTAIAAQSNRSKIKGKRDNSILLKDTPFDVLLEIFRLLEPIDLLHLSRVSKKFHDLLTSDDLSFLWKSAYLNVNQDNRPPRCPDDTNIVFYTNYIYGRHCQFCSSGHGRIYHETAFIRLCSKCADDSFISGQSITPYGRRLCYLWTLPQYKNAGAVLLKVEHSLRLAEVMHAQKKNAEHIYVTERERVVLDRTILALQLAEWRKEMQRIQLENLRLKRHLRETEILKKLEQEEGYNQADINSIKYRLQQAPHVRKSHDLTDSEWHFIRADVLDFLRDVRDGWNIRSIGNRLEGRISQLEWFIYQWKIRPTAWWIASSEPIASFIRIGLSDETYSSSSADFKKFEPQLQGLVASWKEEMDYYLATLIPQSSRKGEKKDSDNSKINALELATTFFKCYRCTEPISYPRILVHGCLRKAVKNKDEVGVEEGDESDMEDLEGDSAVDARVPREPRPPKNITPELVLHRLSEYHSSGMRVGDERVTYDEEASNTARDIIIACGVDPKTVASAAMEQNPIRLECLRCNRAMQAKQKSKSNRLVMKWNMALVHELEDHYDEPPSLKPAWRKVDSLSDLKEVEDAEKRIRNLKRYDKLLFCNHCPCSVFPTNRLYHLKMHNISDPSVVVSDHFSPPVDTSVKMLYPAVKI